MNIGEAINRVAEKTIDNTRELKKSRRQRRTEFTDLYGIPFHATGDANTPARFYISISPDLVYFLRFAFKLYVQSEATDFDISVHGVDVTPYLKEQQGGDWISGTGVFPSREIEDGEDFYDLLDVASLLYSEGNTDDAEKLLKPEFKLIKIEADAEFDATMFLYTKYSVTGR